jgi:hypothetical protein
LASDIIIHEEVDGSVINGKISYITLWILQAITSGRNVDRWRGRTNDKEDHNRCESDIYFPGCSMANAFLNLIGDEE